MNKLILKIDDEFLIKILMQSAQSCNTSVDQVVENIIYGRLAERATRSQVFNDPKKGLLPELFLENRQLKYRGKEVAVFVSEIAKKELSLIKEVSDKVETINKNVFEAVDGFNA